MTVAKSSVPSSSTGVPIGQQTFMITSASGALSKLQASGGTVEVTSVSTPKTQPRTKVISLTVRPSTNKASTSTSTSTSTTPKTERKRNTASKSKKKTYKTPQDKADEIIAQALVDAQQKGITQIPRVVRVAGATSDKKEDSAEKLDKPKKKRERKPKVPKERKPKSGKKSKAAKKKR